jgi:hypothetical protein
VSIPRLLNILAFLLFIVFVATFFTVLVQISRTEFLTERYAAVPAVPIEGEPAVTTWFDLLGQEKDTGLFSFHVRARIDTRSDPFNTLDSGDTVVLRVENMIPELRRNCDLVTTFQNPAGDQYVNLDFGELQWEVLDRRDFYPFDGYEFSMNFACHIPGDDFFSAGIWVSPQLLVMRSFTNMILLGPRYSPVLPDSWGFRARIVRFRMQQFLTLTLLLIELLFLIYLVTLVDLQELLAKGLGYLVVLYIIRNILVTDAPQFPTFVDYSTLFFICVTFFLMLLKFLRGAEEHTLITLPPAWRAAFFPGKEEEDEKKDEGQGAEADAGESEE